ncbi:MAG: hypothetical protein NVS4B13_10540 [Candidatus Elarobacter sp.]
MERMPDGRSDTWAVWKNDVLGLPDVAIDHYLGGVEGYTPEQITAFRASSSAVVPTDWETSDDARAAVSRLFEFRRTLGARSQGDPQEQQQHRGAAMPPAHDPPQPRESAPFVGGPNEAQAPPRDGSPDAVESNASGYGAAFADTGNAP